MKFLNNIDFNKYSKIIALLIFILPLWITFLTFRNTELNNLYQLQLGLKDKENSELKAKLDPDTWYQKMIHQKEYFETELKIRDEKLIELNRTNDLLSNKGDTLLKFYKENKDSKNAELIRKIEIYKQKQSRDSLEIAYYKADEKFIDDYFKSINKWKDFDERMAKVHEMEDDMNEKTIHFLWTVLILFMVAVFMVAINEKDKSS
jgi:hypothetical protein